MPPLKQWLRQEDIYDNDLYDVLNSYGIRDAPKDLKKISQSKWDVIWRKCTVEKFKELKDQTSRNRLQKKMKKLEKVWRQQTGIKITSIKTNERERHKNTKTKKKKGRAQQPRTKRKNKNKSKSSRTNQSSGKNTKTKKKKQHSKQPKKKRGYSLKIWMQKNGCFELELHRALLRKGVDSPKSIKNLSETQFDNIVRRVRVERFAELKDQAAR
eukprot:66958_1